MKVANKIFRKGELVLTLVDNKPLVGNKKHLLGIMFIDDAGLINKLRDKNKEDIEVVFK